MIFVALSQGELQSIIIVIIASAFIFLLLNLGFALPYSLYMIRKKRLEIAETMNAAYIGPEALQSSQQVPSADMEIQYMPSTNTFQPQVIPRGQILQIPTVIHSQPIPGHLKEQEKPRLEQNMDDNVPFNAFDKHDTNA